MPVIGIDPVEQRFQDKLLQSIKKELQEFKEKMIVLGI